MNAVIWYSVAVAGPLVASITVGAALLVFSILRATARCDIPHYLSLKLIWPGFRPLKNITWLNLITGVIFVSANAVAMSYDIADTQGLVRRSGLLSAINMAPLFLGAKMNPIASGCGLSLQTYVGVHRWLGVMAILQGLGHAALALSTQAPGHFGELSDKSGVVVASVFVAIPLTSILKRRAYEMFSALHFALALCAAAFTYLHAPYSRIFESPRRYLLAAAGCLGLSWLTRLGLVIYRNVGFHSLSSRAAIQVITFELENAYIPLDDAVHIHVRLLRPWNVRAGQYVYLTVPGASRTSFAQSHPFYVAWWYRVDDDNYIVLIAQRRQGFTENLLSSRLRRTSARALIEGPYGKEMSLDSYDNVLLFATGMGIAGQLSYVAQLLRGYYDCGVKTKRVTLFWQVDSEIQLGWVADRMQQMLELDEKSQVLQIHLFVVDQFVSREALASNPVNRGKRISVTYSAMEAGKLAHGELARHTGRTVITLCADPHTVDQVRGLVQRLADTQVHVRCLDFCPG